MTGRVAGKVALITGAARDRDAVTRSTWPGHPTKDDAIAAFPVLQAMPVPWVEPADISQIVLFLASAESRYVTGQFIACDAGGHLKI